MFFAAHGTGYAEDGGVGSAGNECYRARVTRGPSLLVTEATQVVPLPKQKNAQLAHADSVFFQHIMPGEPRVAEVTGTLADILTYALGHGGDNARNHFSGLEFSVHIAGHCPSHEIG